MGGASGSSFHSLGPVGKVGEISNLLLLLRGVARFLDFGVRGEFEILETILEPLAVFSSVQITLSYFGDEDTVRDRFPRIMVVSESCRVE